MKYCGSHLTFYFFIKTKKMVFLEVTVTIIGENTSIKCLQCIKYDNSYRKIGPFVKVIHRSSH